MCFPFFIGITGNLRGEIEGIYLNLEPSPQFAVAVGNYIKVSMSIPVSQLPTGTANWEP